jgi:hypothetical protein
MTTSPEAVFQHGSQPCQPDDGKTPIWANSEDDIIREQKALLDRINRFIEEVQTSLDKP